MEDDNDNVVELGNETMLNIPAERVLKDAMKRDLAGVFIVGWEDGEEYMASSIAEGGDILWLIERAKHKLMKAADMKDKS